MATTPLAHTWCVTFIHRRDKGEYDQGIKTLGTFGTAEEFWALYLHLKRPADLPYITEYHIFREGIKPLWEDPGNADGGKLILRVRKELSSRLWEDLLLAIVGEQFDVGEEICGAVMSVRGQENIISVWTRTGKDHATITHIANVLRSVLGLPSTTRIEYKEHNQSLQDKSSFRNPGVFL